MPQPIVISGFTFTTKKAAKEFIGRIRDKYADGIALQEPDHLILEELLSMHPEALDKIGCGINQFSVRTDSVFRRTRHFVVHRTDGTHTDFSFHSCIDGSNPRRDRLEALRRALEPSILRFRDLSFKAPYASCPLTGTAITPHTCHIDHAPPNTFVALVERWLENAAISLEQIAITRSSDNQTVSRMTDEIQRSSWVRFHDLHASLRTLSQRGNLSTAKLKVKSTDNAQLT